MTNKIIVLNNKSNFTKDEYLKYISELEMLNNSNIILCPSTCYLSIDTKLELGSQNVSSYHSGSYTGEVNAEQLKSLGINYSIVGHYEREHYLRETLDDVKEKIKRLIENNITPIICVGESLDEYNTDLYIEKVLSRIDYLLNGIDYNKVIIAFEPFFSIGGSNIPDISKLNSVLETIKNKYNTKVLYGGSVTLDNISILNESNYLDGYLLGNLSLQVSDISKLIEVL